VKQKGKEGKKSTNHRLEQERRQRYRWLFKGKRGKDPRSCRSGGSGFGSPYVRKEEFPTLGFFFV